MRKLLILVAVLALLAIPAVPAAAQTVVSGNVPLPVLTITPPGPLAFGTFVLGLNIPVPSGTTGAVSVANEVVGVTTWTVTTSASNDGYMGLVSPSANDLAERLQISKDNTAWVWANGVLTYSPNPTTLPFYARQNTSAPDFDDPGAYVITITFTGNLTL